MGQAWWYISTIFSAAIGFGTLKCTDGVNEEFYPIFAVLVYITTFLTCIFGLVNHVRLSKLLVARDELPDPRAEHFAEYQAKFNQSYGVGSGVVLAEEKLNTGTTESSSDSSS